MLNIIYKFMTLVGSDGRLTGVRTPVTLAAVCRWPPGQLVSTPPPPDTSWNLVQIKYNIYTCHTEYAISRSIPLPK